MFYEKKIINLPEIGLFLKVLHLLLHFNIKNKFRRVVGGSAMNKYPTCRQSTHSLLYAMKKKVKTGTKGWLFFLMMMMNR
jgi:hypothetical protein